jgi:mono/diheme cytochrome c family protein
MKKVAALLALLVMTAACGGDSTPAPTGVAATGEDLLRVEVLGTNPGCVTCHSLRPGVTLLGPSLAGIGVDGADRVEGQDAATYIRASIVDPAAFVVDGYDADRMPDDWSDQLSDAEIDALVAYLLTRTDQ